MLLASPDYAKAHGLKPRARVVAMANMGDSPTLMLNAPVPAARKVLAKAGLTKSTTSTCGRSTRPSPSSPRSSSATSKLDRDKVNVNGGSMALGHPIGATGADPDRHRPRRARAPQTKQFGLVTMCAAGGMAPAIIIERRLAFR
jgi:acetyl-CoA C-acetyltransferase